ncbi:uncharacterized protein LOC108467588 [Gossypium arboreum]|uniref:uncharacterized protein LOC108467588 n=1 Tax=Gossypium arboreum TaxID=29729 RepID=UPI0022F1A357|nr:uncharacterized protein LOC108467588 [Gossypium arboreum]
MRLRLSNGTFSTTALTLGGRRRWPLRRKLLRNQKGLPRKPRGVSMWQGSLRNAKKIANNLILTLKNNLVVVDCWHAYLPGLVNVAELMGTYWKVKNWSSI